MARRHRIPRFHHVAWWNEKQQNLPVWECKLAVQHAPIYMSHAFEISDWAAVQLTMETDCVMLPYWRESLVTCEARRRRSSSFAWSSIEG